MIRDLEHAYTLIGRYQYCKLNGKPIPFQVWSDYIRAKSFIENPPTFPKSPKSETRLLINYSERMDRFRKLSVL